MNVTAVKPRLTSVYIVLGIDEEAQSQVLSVFNSYNEAKKFCCQTIYDTGYGEWWIEKHLVL